MRQRGRTQEATSKPSRTDRARRMPRVRQDLALGVLLAAAAFSCSHYTQTVRVYQGRTRVERAIAPEAYEAYTLGAIHEQQAEWGSALAQYQIALDRDPQSPEIRARIALAACHHPGAPAARELFEDLLADSPDYAPAWWLASECALHHGHVAGALELARRALDAAPLAPEATRVLASSLRASGRAREAARVERAWLLLRVQEPPAHAGTAFEAAPASTPGRGRTGCERSLRATDANPMFQELCPVEQSVDAVAALLDAGRAAEALLIAERLSSADPTSSEARIWLLVAADRSGNQAAFHRGLARPTRALRSEISKRSRDELKYLLARTYAWQAAAGQHAAAGSAAE